MTAPTSTPATTRQWAALAILTLAVVLLAVDGTVLALAVPALTADLNPTATQLLWIGDIYSFALAGLLITMGNLADRIGRKKLLLIGAVGFGAASALAAFASTPELLIAARALLGISGATLMPSTLSIIRNVFEDPRQRTTAIAVWSAGATGGAAMGPLVGGALLEHFWWGSVFLINIPVMLVLLIGGIFILPESKNPAGGRIDLLSAVLSMASVIPLVYAIKHFVGNGFDLTVVAGLVVGITAVVLFIRRQRRLADPMIDLSLFSNPAFSGGVGANTLAIFAFSGLLFFFSQYLQLVRGFSPLQAGIAELPTTIASIAVIFVIGALTRRLGAGRAIGLGLGFAAVGLGFLAVAEGLPSYFWIAIALVVIGLGVGVAMTLSTDAIVSAVPRERAGAASSISETGYELGIALGIAVLGSMQTAFYRATVTIPEETPTGIRNAVNDSLASASSALHGRSGFEEVLASAQHAFAGGMQITAVIAGVLLLVAAVIAWKVIPSKRGDEVDVVVVPAL